MGLGQVEDIIDTGKTLRRVCDTLAAAGAASVKVVVLLDKAERRTVDIQPDYRALHVGLVLACSLQQQPAPMLSLSFSLLLPCASPQRTVQG